jgi:putative colanic acid biosynthesis acetyltransferase WcaF
MAPELNISSNRSAAKYSNRELVRRATWTCAQWFFRLTPRPCFAARQHILRCFGAAVGPHVHTYPSTRIYFPWNLFVGDWTALGEDVLIYNLGPVIIGRKVTISHGAHLCGGTHDYRRSDFPLLKPPIRIEDQAWICADAFVGPGITVGQGAIVGARSVVTKDVQAWSVVAGNPAKPIGTRELQDACVPANLNFLNSKCSQF